MDNEDIFQGTILKEIADIKEENYIDGKYKKASREKPKGVLTEFEKRAYTLYKRDMEILKKMEAGLADSSLSDEEKTDLNLQCNILSEKIKIISKLFTFTVRSRLGIWEGSMIAVRKGFEVVIVHEYWSREVGPVEAAKIIKKEKGVTTSQTGSA